MGGRTTKVLPLVEAINLILWNIIQSNENGTMLTEDEIRQIKDLLENGTGGGSGGQGGFTKSQIINFVRNDLKTNKITDEMLDIAKLNELVQNYLTTQGITVPKTDSEINGLIRDYLIANPIRTRTDEEINNLISNYLVQNNIENISEVKVKEILSTYLTEKELPKTKEELKEIIQSLIGNGQSGNSLSESDVERLIESYLTNKSLPKSREELSTLITSVISASTLLNDKIREYFVQNPVNNLSEEDIKGIIRQYLIDNPISGGGSGLNTEQVQGLINQFFVQNELPLNKENLITLFNSEIEKYNTQNNIRAISAQDYTNISEIPSIRDKKIVSFDLEGQNLSITLGDNSKLSVTLPSSNGGELGGQTNNKPLFKEFEYGEVTLSKLPIIKGSGNSSVSRINFKRAFSQTPMVVINHNEEEMRLVHIFNVTSTYVDTQSNYFNGRRKMKYFAFVIDEQGLTNAEFLTDTKLNELKMVGNLRLEGNNLLFTEGTNTSEKQIVIPLSSGGTTVDEEQIRQIVNDTIVDKLDKGTYQGTAQDLKNEIDGKIANNSLHSVATSGNYSELNGKPNLDIYETIENATNKYQPKGTYVESSALHTVATSGNYDDLANLPNLTQYETVEGARANYQPIGDYATKSEVNTKIQDIIGTAPENLNTLQELAQALENDPNKIGTIISQLSGKLDKGNYNGTAENMNEKIISLEENAQGYQLISNMGSYVTKSYLNSLKSTQYWEKSNDKLITEKTLGDCYVDMLRICNSILGWDSWDLPTIEAQGEKTAGKYYRSTQKGKIYYCKETTTINNIDSAKNEFEERTIVDLYTKVANNSGSQSAGYLKLASPTKQSVSSEVEFTGNVTTNTLFVTGEIEGISDTRLKDNKIKIKNPLYIIDNLNGYTYDFKLDNSKRMGVVAQEVEKVLPLAVNNQILNDFEYKTVNYIYLIPVLIEAIKELNQEIKNLKGDK